MVVARCLLVEIGCDIECMQNALNVLTCVSRVYIALRESSAVPQFLTYMDDESQMVVDTPRRISGPGTYAASTRGLHHKKARFVAFRIPR